LLNIVTVAYAGQTAALALSRGTVAERRDQLFGSYVDQMLRRRAAERRYARELTTQWLSWLACQMAKHGQTVFNLERLQRDWLPTNQFRAIQASAVLISGLVIALVFGLVSGLVRGLDYILVLRLIFGLIFGVVFGLGLELFSLSKEIVCVETVSWSWSRRWRSGSWLTAFAPAITVGGLVFGLVRGESGGLVFGLVSGLFAVLVGGLTYGEIDNRSIPNEGIRRSARNALFGAIIVGLVVGLVGGLFPGQSAGPLSGLFVGLFVGLVAGGHASLKHVVLRLWLIRNGSTPWNYVRFLDYAADRILLRKVGGGYVFLHRMLMDWFAARYDEDSAKGQALESRR
jgi:hypothetical protein